MLELLKKVFEESAKAEIKNNILSSAIKQIDGILEHIKEEHKEANLEKLVPKLVALAEEFSEKMASEQIKFSNDLHICLKSEVKSCGAEINTCATH